MFFREIARRKIKKIMIICICFIIRCLTMIRRYRRSHPNFDGENSKLTKFGLSMRQDLLVKNLRIHAINIHDHWVEISRCNKVSVTKEVIGMHPFFSGVLNLCSNFANFKFTVKLRLDSEITWLSSLKEFGSIIDNEIWHHHFRCISVCHVMQ
jgi:hypothetical protein